MGASKARKHGERIAELCEGRGWSYARIARDIGISAGAVAWYCLIEGIESPKPPRAAGAKPGPMVMTRGGHVVRRHSDEDDARLLALEAQRLSYSEIGRVLGRQPNSVRGRLATLARRANREDAA